MTPQNLLVGFGTLLVVGFLVGLGFDIRRIIKNGYDPYDMNFFVGITIIALIVVAVVFLSNLLGSLIWPILQGYKG